MENRRLFTRVLFSIKAVLIVEEEQYPVTIHDISLNGALVTRPSSKASLAGKLGVLNFSLEPDLEPISIHVGVVHVEEDEIGLQCNAIDIDSLSLLRRLIELNLGDDAQLNKELSQLNSNK